MSKIWVGGGEVELKTYKVISTVEAIPMYYGEAGKNGYLPHYRGHSERDAEEGYVFINALGNKQWTSKERFEGVLYGSNSSTPNNIC